MERLSPPTTIHSKYPNFADFHLGQVKAEACPPLASHRSISTRLCELGALTSLPDALKRLRTLEKRLAAIEALHAPGQSSVSSGPGEHAGDPGVPVIPEDGELGEYEGQSGPPLDVGPVG